MPTFALFQNFGGPELLIVLVVILIFFGPKKLPDLSRAIGKSIGEFKKGRQELDEEVKEELGEADKAAETASKESVSE